jgi:hypothetical protein
MFETSTTNKELTDDELFAQAEAEAAIKQLQKLLLINQVKM